MTDRTTLFFGVDGASWHGGDLVEAAAIHPGVPFAFFAFGLQVVRITPKRRSVHLDTCLRLDVAVFDVFPWSKQSPGAFSVEEETLENQPIGRYLDLKAFCTCTGTYQRYAEEIDPYPEREESVQALQALAQEVLDPIITHFGIERFQLTYGFCSKDLKRVLLKRDPQTGQRHGRVAPELDQHMAHERKRTNKPYCDRLGAACDFRIQGTSSEMLVSWILQAALPFDSLYYYGPTRPIHISHGPQHKRDLWTFSPRGQPTKKGLDAWLQQLESE